MMQKPFKGMVSMQQVLLREAVAQQKKLIEEMKYESLEQLNAKAESQSKFEPILKNKKG